MNNQMSFDINCKDCSVSPNGYNYITLTVGECDKTDLLELMRDTFSVKEIMDYLDESEVLDHIGSDTAKKHFDLTDL